VRFSYPFIIVTCAATLALLCSCGGSPSPIPANQSATANANAGASNVNAQAKVASSPAYPSKNAAQASTAQGGEPIDTSEYDAQIRQAEQQPKKKPNDAAARNTLARAYLLRGNALTQARQYRAALGDYRRALRYDPNNAEAKQWSATITGILQQMGRDVPAEGTEPTPLPLSKK
jgi:tetratricopeptide (TPR) repeat protein